MATDDNEWWGSYYCFKCGKTVPVQHKHVQDGG